MKKFVVLWACWAAWWGRIMGGEGRLGDRDMLSSSVESRLPLGSFCSSIAGGNLGLCTPNSTCCSRPPSVSNLAGQHVKNKPRMKQTPALVFNNITYSGDMSSSETRDLAAPRYDPVSLPVCSGAAEHLCVCAQTLPKPLSPHRVFFSCSYTQPEARVRVHTCGGPMAREDRRCHV